MNKNVKKNVNQNVNQNSAQPSSSYAPFQGIKNVVVVFSSISQAFDESSITNFVMHAYPGAKVYFLSTSGQAVGEKCITRVDLVIDLTQPGARQGFLFPLKMRKLARYAIGRKAGFYFRTKLYDRVYDEKKDASKPGDYLDGERWAQRKVLELSGVPVIRQGGVTEDRSKDIAFETH